MKLALAAILAGCATVEEPSHAPGYQPLTAAEGRALGARALPESVKERSGWATDIYAAFATLDVAPTSEGVCAAIAVIEQESGFQVDPVVPGLAGIARKEIERRRESAGIPRFTLDAALALSSGNGKSYAERLDTVRTERQLSEIYEDFIDKVPFGQRLLADRNPVRTGGPMQVSVAFQAAVTQVSGVPLERDGDLLRYEHGEPTAAPGSTELATRAIARRIDLTDADIRSDLELGKGLEFTQSRVYARVFDLADRLSGKPVPRAAVPQIPLASPKITRNLTTDWFATRVDTRYRSCLVRMRG